MTRFTCVTLASCLMLMTASLAAAQGRPASPAFVEHGYMTGSAGAAFSDQRTPTFGVEIGERLNARTQAYVAFTYFDNLFSNRAASDLTNLANALSGYTGRPWAFTGRDRGMSFSGGAKYLLSTGPKVRPYVGGAPGVLNIRRTINEQFLGDVSDPVLTVFGAPDGLIDPNQTSSFKPFAEFIGGVGIASGRAYVDVGYRFRMVLTTDEPLSFGQFSVGVGMRF